METVSLTMIFEILKNFGPIGLIAVMWWTDLRSMKKVMDDNKKHVDGILSRYKLDMDDIRRMYESNVRLVEEQNELGNRYALLSQDLKDAYIMTAQINQRLADSIESNQYCPMVRLEKRAAGIVG